MILACIEPIRADPLLWESWYVTCDFCQQSACEDIWAGRLAEESWRLFYALVGEGLVVCEHCLPELEKLGETMPAMNDATCPKCRRRFGWPGELVNCPPCPRCGHQIPPEDWAHDQAVMDQANRDMLLPGYNSREKCKSCGAEILFVVTANDKLLPIDPTPLVDGNVVLDSALDRARVLRGGEAWEGGRYQSHSVSCPHAAAHRRKKT